MMNNFLSKFTLSHKLCSEEISSRIDLILSGIFLYYAEH